MKLSKLALAAGMAVALVASTGGCSKSDDKDPKMAGGGSLPNAKPIGRGAVGTGKPSAGPGNQAPLTKN